MNDEAAGDDPAERHAALTLKLPLPLLRCIDFRANFGQVELRAANPAAAAAAAAAPAVQGPAVGRRRQQTSTPPQPPPGPPPLENCAPLTGRYRVHWQVSKQRRVWLRRAMPAHRLGVKPLQLLPSGSHANGVQLCSLGSDLL